MKFLARLHPKRYRLRLLFRGSFLLLALAILGMTYFVLREEKALSYQNYQNGFRKTLGQIVARLRHPSGQLALLNPAGASSKPTPLRPLLLPFSALDFDDQSKVQQGIEMSGCLVQYPDNGAACVAIGNKPWAGGFFYVAGRFASPDLQNHPRGDKWVEMAHRVRITAQVRGQTYQWIAPVELSEQQKPGQGLRGRLTGFIGNSGPLLHAKPDKEFRGWIWQEPYCVEDDPAPVSVCSKRSFFSVRLPIAALQGDVLHQPRALWPPADLAQMQVRVEVLAPGEGLPLFDSNRPQATPLFSLNDLAPLLLPGETLQITRPGSHDKPYCLIGSSDSNNDASPLIQRLIGELRVEGGDAPLVLQDEIATPLGNYELKLTGDVRTVNQSLSRVATRISWMVAAMLTAIAVVWLLMEASLIRRIIVLQQRANRVSRSMHLGDGLAQLDLNDLRGSDELGVLAACLSDLLQRVREDLNRERIRAEQEKDMWHAVGHEIMSPLQSLKALHGTDDNESNRYINRMQQAVRVLYGSASPSEAIQSTTLDVDVIDLNAFLHNVASNAHFIEVDNVWYVGDIHPLLVRAEEYALEDVVSHILRNAARYRVEGSRITITLQTTPTTVSVSIHNQGPPIDDEMLDKVFEYGVSDQLDSGANGNRGQGLFVAKTYMAKMGGTIAVSNIDDGVCFVLTLQRAADSKR